MSKRHDIDRLQREIHELFVEVWQVPRFSGPRRGFRPQVDCYRTEDPPELRIVVELPGVVPESVQIVATDQAVAIAGERPRPHCEGRVYQQMEIDYGPFHRQIQLAEEVDTEAAEATYERGLLTIVLPLAKLKPRSQKVPIAVKTRP